MEPRLNWNRNVIAWVTNSGRSGMKFCFNMEPWLNVMQLKANGTAWISAYEKSVTTMAVPQLLFCTSLRKFTKKATEPMGWVFVGQKVDGWNRVAWHNWRLHITWDPASENFLNDYVKWEQCYSYYLILLLPTHSVVIHHLWHWMAYNVLMCH